MTLIEKITKDFSPENRHRLFKGLTKSGVTRWYFCKKNVDTTEGMYDQDFLYFLEYDSTNTGKVLIGKINESYDILQIEEGAAIYIKEILKNLDNEVNAAALAEVEVKKQLFIESVLNC